MHWITLLISIIICFSAGALGTVATSKNIPNWYSRLKKPSFNPPNTVFGPVWTVLYILMGISLYKILQSPQEHTIAIAVFAIQLILNALWSFIFFGWHKLWLGFTEIVLLWLSIFLTLFLFAKIDISATLLLVPYFAWVSFAALLNFSIAKLNTK